MEKRRVVVADISEDFRRIFGDTIRAEEDMELAGSQIEWYGLKNSSLIIENVPLSIPSRDSENHKPFRVMD